MARDLIPSFEDLLDPREAAARMRAGIAVQYGHQGPTRASDPRLDLLMATLAEALDRITALEHRVGLSEDAQLPTPADDEAEDDVLPEEAARDLEA